MDRTLFWTAADLELKVREFQGYFNGHRTHAALGRLTPKPRTGEDSARQCQYVSLPAPPSWAVSDADRGMTRVRRRLATSVPHEMSTD